jgi:predicted negative regulator of RcsB-dependent stress response
LVSYRTEEEQIALIKRLWDNYGTALLTAVLLAVVAIAGWRYWHAHQQAEAEAASGLYQQMLNHLDQWQQSHSIQPDGPNPQAAQVISYANQLVKEYPSSSYGQFAGLTLAKLAVADKKFDVAEKQLRWVLAQKPIATIQHVSQARLATVLWQQGKDQQALDLLQQGGGAMQATYDELKGDIYFSQGKLDQARSAYQAALKTFASNKQLAEGTNNPALSILQLKLDDLAVPQKANQDTTHTQSNQPVPADAKHSQENNHSDKAQDQQQKHRDKTDKKINKTNQANQTSSNDQQANPS